MKTIAIHTNNQPEFDRELIAGLPASGPRYTSYPTADRFHNGFGEAEYANALELRGLGALNKPLSLYIHIPFCNTICYYCGCNKIITKDKSRADAYIEYLEREMDLLAPHLNGRHQLAQLHFGGGTPTFLSDEQLERVFAMIRKHFQLIPSGEYSIEIDPRKVSRDTVFHLGRLGFNRMSVGIQDFDPKVQAAVNRIQTVEETREVIEAAREAGFKSVSVDLIYGLPHQSLESIKPTIDTVLALDPDRLALYHYAHLPHIFKPQRRIDTEAVPGSEEKLDILQYAVHTLTERGYVFIGMDHFAKPDDELAVAQRQGRLHRNFQGYSTYADCDMLSFGISSISKVGPTYYQNVKTLDDYYDRLDAGVLPVFRGIEMNADDILRRSIIQALMCHFELSIESIEVSHLIDFRKYFADELEDLKEMERAGLVKVEREWITVLPPGRMLVRIIAMLFDRYLRADRQRTRYSKVI